MAGESTPAKVQLVRLMRLPFTAQEIAIGLFVAMATFWSVATWAGYRLIGEADVARFSTSQGDARWGQGYMPNLPVVDQDGNTFRFYDDLIKDKKVIVSFIFTSCSQICPLVTSRMAMLQERLGDAVGRDYFMYSITVDPLHDGPRELKRHANAYNVKPGWKFLTGRPEDIQAINDKLGERSTSLGDHRQDILIGDDSIQNWSKNSVFGDLDALVLSIRMMDPTFDREALLRRAAVADLQAIELAPGQAVFGKMCASCHTIGLGKRVGPDLKGVVGKRDKDWLARFIATPDKMFASRDPIALELADQYPDVEMPNLGLTAKDADDVISYLELQSATP